MSHWSYIAHATGERVEAYQLFDEYDENTRAYPRWLLDLFLDRRIEAHNFTNPIWYLDRTEVIPSGAWVIRREDGRIFIGKNEMFVNDFYKEPK
jgi:hypothetical protein